MTLFSIEASCEANWAADPRKGSPSAIRVAPGNSLELE